MVRCASVWFTESNRERRADLLIATVINAAIYTIFILFLKEREARVLGASCKQAIIVYVLKVPLLRTHGPLLLKAILKI